MREGPLDDAATVNRGFPGIWIGNCPSLLVAILARVHVTSWCTGRNLTTETSVSSPPPFDKNRGLLRLRGSNAIGSRRNTTSLSRLLGLVVSWKKRSRRDCHLPCWRGLYVGGSNRVSLPGICWRDMKPAKRGEMSKASKIALRTAAVTESLS